MSKPLLAIVGRPNVGKSTLFNKIVGKRISISHNTPGVTRDRIYADASWCGYNFTVIDTGGIEYKSEDMMWKHIRTQAETAIEIADCIIFVVDGKGGLLPDDFEIAEMLRQCHKPVVLAVNKLDNPFETAYEFYELGLGDPYVLSAEHNIGIGDILEEACKHLKKVEEEGEDESIKIAVVGKPNAGKSSLVNKILGTKRTIVSDVAGTTRDAIDSPFEHNGEKFTLIDTAGIRRKRSVEEDVEYYSVLRAFSAIKRADVVLIVVDAEEGLTEQDVRIAGKVHEEGKASIVVMNKWDKIEKDTHTVEKFNKDLKEKLKFMDYFVPAYVSALTGKRVDKLLDEAKRVGENAKRRITTGIVNDVVMNLVAMNEPPTKNGRRLKIFFATQASVCPPSFVVFTNDSSLMHFSYLRYLENGIRESFDFSGTPIRIIVRDKTEENDYNV
ncbi:MAG: ribosome biogenesis GTPase Der [Clostridia bacterium]|nr:ribosome biogenesis GTPase Der [Clostridia bacterium]